MNGKIFFRQISSGTTLSAWSNFYTTAYKPTLSELGAAAAVHTHTKSQITDFPTSLKNPTSIKIQLNGGTSEGTNQFTYDGSVAKNINITPAVIGAATSQHTQAASTITGLTANRALVSDANGHPAVSAVTSTELGYLDGVTSNIQTQLNGKSPIGHTHSYLPLSGGTMTGAITLPGNPTSNLHAATKQYVDSKISGAGKGDMLKSVYDTDADGVVDKAEKLGTARTISLGVAAVSTATSFDGSQNITIPVTSVKEAYLSWGGTNLSGALTPVDAALADFASGNRLFGTPASSISVEVSRNGGSTWSAYPGITDGEKRSLVSTETSFTLGGVSSGNTVQDQLRVTIAAGAFYFSCRKVLMDVSTNGATGMKVNIKYSTIGAPDTFKDYGTYPLTGWPGWNSIPLSTTWGGNPDHISQTKKVQFTFSMTGAGPAAVFAIYAYGENAWSFPNIMAKYGRSYDVDYDCNSTFRGKVTLKQDPSSNLEAATKQYVDRGAISTYTHSKTGTVHTLTGSGDNIRFIATADFTSGDTFKIGTSAVTAKTIGGDSLWTGFFKNGAVVTCYKNGTTITFNGGGLPSTEAAKLTPENIKTGISITANGKTVNGTFTADGTAAAGDMLAGKVAYVNGQKVTGTIPGNPAEVNLDPPTVTNSGLVYNFNDVNTYYTSGYYWSPNEDITSAIKLTSDKLKSGEKVLGVTGSFTSDANATSNDLRSGKTAYVNGQKISGGLASRDTGTPNPIEYVRLANGRFEVAPPAGIHGCYWDGGQYSYLNYDQVRNAIGLTADKIASGNQILGIQGTYIGRGGERALLFRENQGSWFNAPGYYWQWNGDGFTCLVAGNYRVNAHSTVNDSSDGTNYLKVFVNGNIHSQAKSSYYHASLQFDLWFNVGSYISFYVDGSRGDFAAGCQIVRL